MRVLKVVFTLALFLMGTHNVNAQRTATATMRVSVTIVSGATLNNVETLNVDFDSQVSTGGTLSLKVPDNVDTQVEVEKTITLTNQFGDKVMLNSGLQHEILDDTHLVSLTPEIPSMQQGLTGNYTGTVVTIVNYL